MMKRASSSRPSNLGYVLALLFHSPLLSQGANLEVVRDAIVAHHPGPVGYDKAKFMTQLKRGYEAERSALDKTSGKTSDEYFSLLRFVAGFRDSHLTIQFANQELTKKYVVGRWPHFVVFKIGAKFLVREVDGSVSQTEVPPLNAELKDCDGKSVDQLFAQNIFPFYGNPKLAAHRHTLAWRLFWDNGNPYIQRPETCRFVTQGKALDFKLKWTDLDVQEHLKTHLLPHGIYSERKLTFEKEGQVVWITLPNFAPVGDEIATFKTFAKNLQNIAPSSKLVFDLRGNSGGDSDWGDLLLRSLYGPSFSGLPRKNVQIVYRVSDENFKHWEAVEKRQIEQFGTSAHFSLVVKKMREALQAKKSIVTILSEDTKTEATPTSGIDPSVRVFALTDGFCFSACLSFLDKIRDLRAQQIGQETGADSLYMDVRHIDLPGGTYRLTVPLKYFKNRPRGNNESYRPDIQWNHDIHDTSALKKWVLDL